jgi:hypothetical protein
MDLCSCHDPGIWIGEAERPAMTAWPSREQRRSGPTACLFHGCPPDMITSQPDSKGTVPQADG